MNLVCFQNFSFSATKYQVKLKLLDFKLLFVVWIILNHDLAVWKNKKLGFI